MIFLITLWWGRNVSTRYVSMSAASLNHYDTFPETWRKRHTNYWLVLYHMMWYIITFMVYNKQRIIYYVTYHYYWPMSISSYRSKNSKKTAWRNNIFIYNFDDKFLNISNSIGTLFPHYRILSSSFGICQCMIRVNDLPSP